jgi:hypothetical protein
MTSASDEKMTAFTFFSIQGTGGSPTVPDSENGVGDQENGKGLQVPDEP